MDRVISANKRLGWRKAKYNAEMNAEMEKEKNRERSLYENNLFDWLILSVSILTLCVAAVGCAPDPAPEPTLQFDAEAFKAASAARWAQFNEGLRKKEACMIAAAHLKIGTGADAAVRTLPCEPDRVNRTETASGFRDQWVFEFGRISYYLYFTNGVLVAKQT